MIQPDPTTRPKPRADVQLAVVMPVFGNWGDTLDCLQMLAGQSNRDFHVILADDGSPDPPPEHINTFPFVTYVRYPHAGFAATCNAAVTVAARLGCTHVLLLNNDTSFAPDFIDEWLAKVAENPQAIMSPMIFFSDRQESIWYSGGSRSVAVPFFRLRRTFTKQTAVEVLTACVLLVPMPVWDRLKGFDERFVTYYEDFDFMLRAQKLGIPAYVVVEKSLRVFHKVSRSALSCGRWNRDYQMIVSRLFFIRRQYAGIEKAFCLCMAIPHLVLIACGNVPELPNPRLLWNAIWKGLTIETAGQSSQRYARV